MHKQQNTDLFTFIGDTSSRIAVLIQNEESTDTQEPSQTINCQDEIQKLSITSSWLNVVSDYIALKRYLLQLHQIKENSPSSYE
jgi:hypothetical protein